MTSHTSALRKLESGRTDIRVVRLYTSKGHNFFGHHGRRPGEHLLEERESISCIAGRGVEGDRFFDYKENYRGQVTFLSWEVFSEVCEQLGIRGKDPGETRRNVITRGVDLNSLIGAEFVVQGVKFLGVEECRPCYWMDRALGSGAEAALRGRGGLRAKILSSGTLRVDS